MFNFTLPGFGGGSSTPTSAAAQPAPAINPVPKVKVKPKRRAFGGGAARKASRNAGLTRDRGQSLGDRTGGVGVDSGGIERGIGGRGI